MAKTTVILHRCPKCGILGEREAANLVQGWRAPAYPDDDGYTEEFFHECRDIGPDDDPRRVDEVALTEQEDTDD
jgi:hypothetical protein